MEDDSPYIPGVCNINEVESSRRKRAGWLGVYIGAIFAFPLIVFNIHPAAGLIMFVPSWLAALGFLQAKEHFCLAYAASGKYNANENYAETGTITNKHDTEKDQEKAKKIHINALGWGFAGALVWIGILVGLRMLR